MADNIADFIAELGLKLDVEDALFPSLPEPVRLKQFRRKPDEPASITRVYLYRNCNTKQLLTVREILGDRDVQSHRLLFMRGAVSLQEMRRRIACGT